MFSNKLFEQQGKIVELIYEAAADPELWPNVLKGVRSFIGVDNASLIMLNSNPATAPIGVTLLGEEFHKLNKKHYHLEPRHKMVEELAPQPGTLIDNEDIVSAKEWMKTQFYQEFHYRYAIPYSVYLSLNNEPQKQAGFTLQTSEQTGPITTHQKMLLMSLAPHLIRAFTIHDKIYGMQAQRDAIVNSLGDSGPGILMIGSDKKVIYASPQAEQLFRLENSIKLKNNCFIITDPTLQQRFDKSVWDILQKNHYKLPSQGDSFSIPRENNPPLLVTVSPYVCDNQSLQFLKETPQVVVYLVDPQPKRFVDHLPLRDLYRLTKAESRIAKIAVTGATISTMAEQLEINKETIKSHLKAIYRKTGTANQSQLVALLLSNRII